MRTDRPGRVSAGPRATNDGAGSTVTPSPFFNFLTIAGAYLASVLLFFLSHPNPLFLWGLGFLGFVALFPFFWALQRTPLVWTPLVGALFGFLSYAAFNYWLGKFHPLALLIVPVIYMAYHILLVPVLALAGRWARDRAFWVQTALWVIYEYLRTQGYLGYSYGILGYTQFTFTPFIQSADLWGVWGITFLVVWPSAWLARLFQEGKAGLASQWRRFRPDFLVWAALILFNLVYGVLAPPRTEGLETRRISLIQHNLDPWQGGFTAYQQGLDRLMLQSRQVMADNPDLVVWSETAFVPSINYHLQYREDPRTFRLVRSLTDFWESQDVAFLTGSTHAQRRPLPGGGHERVNFNAAYFYQPGVETFDVYRKIHLVPFTEHFPYQEQLPWLHRLLVEADTHFWDKGEEFTIFRATGPRPMAFATPICFEDTFGYLTREFARSGAQIIVNITNDSWSYSQASMVQHFSMAVFRAVETRRSVVRSTNGGLTGAIDPRGRILGTLPMFTMDQMTVELPLMDQEASLYWHWGDWFPFFLMVLSVFFLILFRNKVDKSSKV